MTASAQTVRIGLVGDRSDEVVAHRAIPLALAAAAAELRVTVVEDWIPSERASAAALAEVDGVWCVPGSPYRSMSGALAAIRHARERPLPFLGTCGGFQHAVIEYARNVLGWHDADHAETSPDAARAVIAPLACGLLQTASEVRLVPGTRIASAYGTAAIREEYMCRFGVDPAFRASLTGGPLRESATDAAGDLRAVELDGHPSFVATLFQPERAALRAARAPLVVDFVRACARAR